MDAHKIESLGDLAEFLWLHKHEKPVVHFGLGECRVEVFDGSGVKLFPVQASTSQSAEQIKRLA